MTITDLTDLTSDQLPYEAHTACVAGDVLPADHMPAGTQPVRVGGHTLTTSHGARGAHMTPAGGHHLRNDQRSCDPHSRDVVADSSDPTTLSPTPTAGSSGHPLSDDQATPDTQWSAVVADPLAVDQAPCEPPQVGDVDGNISTHSAKVAAAPRMTAPDGWLELRVWAEMFNDAQQARIAAVNRAERGGVDSTLYEPYTAALKIAENVCAVAMRRCYRRVVPAPIIAWQKQNGGIGEHLVARLLGHLGHPRHATPSYWEGTGPARTLYDGDPYERSVAQLWQYCGHGDPTRRVRKGITADELAALGKPNLKMIVHLIADRAILEPGRSVDRLFAGEQHPDEATRHYRAVYERRRVVTADRAHAVDCVRCGPSGKPAQAGSPWSKAHQQADALRVVGKEILRDLWTISG